MIYLEIITSILIAILIAYLYAVRTAILTTSKDEIINILEEEKVKQKYKKLNRIFRNPTSFISSIKSGINFLNMWFGAIVAEMVALPIYRSLGLFKDVTAYAIKYFIILTAVIIFSNLIYIFFEVLPKTIAIKRKERILRASISDIYILYYIFHPISKFGSKMEIIFKKIFGVNRKEEIIYNNSEIQGEVELSEEKGILSKKDGDVISNFLKFDTISVKDIMVPIEKIDMIDINEGKDKIKEKILDRGYSRLPVYDGAICNVIGIINTKAILEAMIKKEKVDIHKIMKPCMKVTSGKRIDLLFEEMQEGKEHMAIVVKNKDMAIGIVTMEDVIEEMVGEIEDDYEKYK